MVKAHELTLTSCLALVLPLAAGGAPARADEAPYSRAPIELSATQLDGLSAGGVSLAIGAVADSAGRLFPAIAIARSQSSLIALKTALSQTDVAAGAAVAVAVGGDSHNAQTGAAVFVDNPMVSQVQTIPVSAGPVSISITTVTAIGMDVMGVFKTR